MNVTGHHEITKRAIQELKLAYPKDPLIADFNIDYVVNDDIRCWWWDEYRLSWASLVPAARDGGESAVYLTGVAVGGSIITMTSKTDMNALGLNSSPPFALFTENMCDYAENPADGSACTDLASVADLGHISDTMEGQSPHFMRPTNQTVAQTHDAVLKFIRAEVTAAAGAMDSKRGSITTEWRPGYGMWTSGLASKHLGRAVHALQDSFAPMHAARKWGSDAAEDPGSITDIYSYGPQDKKAHEEGDKGWMGKKDFSAIGKKAIAATKELIRVALKLTSNPVSQIGPDWNPFASKWLALQSSGK